MKLAYSLFVSVFLVKSAFALKMPSESERLPFFDENLWSFYQTDYCAQGVGEGFRTCQDGSVSFIQPPSRGIGGFEGKCGQTFGANAIAHLCQKVVDPSVFFKRYFRDLTPGVRPGTMVKGLNKAFKKLACISSGSSKLWRKFSLKSEDNFIAKVKELLIPRQPLITQRSIQRGDLSYKRNPVAALIENPGGRYLHWVMIIDQVDKDDTCHFVVNHWDNQYMVPCTTFSEWSYNVGQSYPLILKSYTLVGM